MSEPIFLALGELLGMELSSSEDEWPDEDAHRTFDELCPIGPVTPEQVRVVLDTLDPPTIYARCGCGGVLAGDACMPDGVGDPIRNFAAHHAGCPR